MVKTLRSLASSVGTLRVRGIAPSHYGLRSCPSNHVRERWSHFSQLLTDSPLFFRFESVLCPNSLCILPSSQYLPSGLSTRTSAIAYVFLAARANEAPPRITTSIAKYAFRCLNDRRNPWKSWPDISTQNEVSNCQMQKAEA